MPSDASFTFTDYGLVQSATLAAVKRVGIEVLRDARDYAPRSDRQVPPKNPAAPVTGNLQAKINMQARLTWSGAEAIIGSPTNYAVYQEFGTRFIPARPFLGPALEKARRKWGK